MLPQEFFFFNIRTEISIYQNLEVYKTRMLDIGDNCLFKPDGTCVDPYPNTYGVYSHTQYHYTSMYRNMRPHFDIRNRIYHNSDHLFNWISSLCNVLDNRIHWIMVCRNQITKFHGEPTCYVCPSSPIVRCTIVLM